MSVKRKAPCKKKEATNEGPLKHLNIYEWFNHSIGFNCMYCLHLDLDRFNNRLMVNVNQPDAPRRQLKEYTLFGLIWVYKEDVRYKRRIYWYDGLPAKECIPRRHRAICLKLDFLKWMKKVIGAQYPMVDTTLMINYQSQRLYDLHRKYYKPNNEN